MARNRITLEDWISEVLSDDSRGAPCDLLALVHHRSNGIGEEEVISKSLKGPNGMLPQKAGDLARYFTNKACHFAQDMPGVQDFSIKAFYNSSEAKARHQFSVSDGELTEGKAVPFSRHEASEKGLLAQLMKHNESQAALIQSMAQAFGQMGVNMMGQLAQMRQEQREGDAVMRDMLLNLRREGHEMRIKELEFSRTSRERETLLKLLPGGINMVLGRDVFDSDSADSLILDRIAMSINPQDLEFLIASGKMKKEEAAFLLDRKMKLLDKQKKEQEALREAPPPSEELAKH